MRSLEDVIGEIMFFYGFSSWIYGVVIQVSHPEYLTAPLSHLTPWIRVDTFAMIGFIVSIIGFFMMRYWKEI
jgi:hypothetical protein